MRTNQKAQNIFFHQKNSILVEFNHILSNAYTSQLITHYLKKKKKT